MNSFKTPEMWLGLWALVLVLVEMFASPNRKAIGWLALAGIAGATIQVWNCAALPATELFSGLYIWDGTARFFKLFFLVTSGAVMFVDMQTDSKESSGPAEHFIIHLFICCGLMLLASAVDLILVFVALELVTISFYIVAAQPRNNVLALEAGVKYLIMGALSSGFLVMGIAYVFGLTGSTQYSHILAALDNPATSEGLLGIGFGVAFILIGLGFKMAMVPFHVWAPDVYQGAPTPVTAFLSVGSKAAGFIVLIRVFLEAFGGSQGPVGGAFEWILVIAAAASLLLGNLGAIPQRNFKRMLAYSSIGHTGFILLGVLALWRTPSATVTVSVYLITYLLATLTAFLAFGIAARNSGSDQIHSLAGLWQRSPLLAAAIAVALISLAGIPPLVGFMGKLGIFLAAWESHHYALFWIGAGCAVAGLYYYLNVVKAMFFSEPLDYSPVAVSISARIVLIVCLALIILLGLWAQGLALLVQGIS